MVTIGNYKNTSPFPGFLGKFSRDYAPNQPSFRENGNTHAAPYAFEWGEGGGGGEN